MPIVQHGMHILALAEVPASLHFVNPLTQVPGAVSAHGFHPRQRARGSGGSVTARPRGAVRLLAAATMGPQGDWRGSLGGPGVLPCSSATVDPGLAWGRELEQYDGLKQESRRLLTGGPRGAVQERAAVASTAARLRAGVLRIRRFGGGGVDMESSRSHAQSRMCPGAARGPVTCHTTFTFTGRNG